MEEKRIILTRVVCPQGHTILGVARAVPLILIESLDRNVLSEAVSTIVMEQVDSWLAGNADQNFLEALPEGMKTGRPVAPLAASLSALTRFHSIVLNQASLPSLRACLTDPEVFSEGAKAHSKTLANLFQFFCCE
jgi:hypothetical protein